MDDLDLVQRCILGDASAWDRLVRRHVPVLHAAVTRTVGPSEAEDVLQRVFLKLWEDGRRRLRTYHGGSRLSTWLVAIAHREAIDRARAAGVRTRTTASLAAVLNGHANPHAAPADRRAEDGESERALLGAIEGLPARDRLLVRLVCLDARPYAEVARLLAVPENSISPWLQRAKERLKAALRERPALPRTEGTPRPV
jgi:RNA polymerase sigma-70 factor (ECF subfamily)